MSFKTIKVLLIIFSFSLINIKIYSQEKFTKKDVELFVQKAVDYVKKNGKDAALKEFINPKGEFLKGKNGILYIYAYDFKGIVLAHGGKPKLAGFNLLDIKDIEGHYPVQIMIKAAKNNQNHWASYTWTNPATKKVERKIGYSVSVDNTWWLGSGLYESEENK